MPRDREGYRGYWALTEVERELRNALSIVREAEGLLADPSSFRAEVSKVAEDLGNAVALAAASRRRALEEWWSPRRRGRPPEPLGQQQLPAAPARVARRP